MELNKVCFFITLIIVVVTIVSCKKEVATAPTPTVPILTTIAISDITQSTATTGGNIAFDGGTTVSAGERIQFLLSTIIKQQKEPVPVVLFLIFVI